ncbi:integrating conjugative element protein (TIGR03746 family) [Erwinia toletana]|uniref:Integrating conjugative element protein (TIGR03746 family) n=1 Tax=Winslowiella toletana TaxID=92490 RepID=A0ABS4PDJ9_9GAMM|nr:TIGR03746 family integrating conjugative element protein [Winslowiella toletana]MBP2170716.1 integrating conjugative element protein (TIGR03746 family) [Winslowiella toletana]
MSQFRHALAERDSHLKSLKIALMVQSIIIAGMGYGWYSAPQHLTVYLPPDLRSGSTQPWWLIPPASVYAFTVYLFQQLNRWPANGEADYARNIHRLQAYITPSCLAWLNKDYQLRKEGGELRDRVRGVYEIPDHGFGDSIRTAQGKTVNRVQVLSRDSWRVMLDVAVDEYLHNEPVKRVLVRYPLKVVRYAIDAEKNPWGLAIDCFAGAPQHLVADTPLEPL